MVVAKRDKTTSTLFDHLQETRTTRNWVDATETNGRISLKHETGSYIQAVRLFSSKLYQQKSINNCRIASMFVLI